VGDSAILAIWETQCQHGENQKRRISQQKKRGRFSIQVFEFIRRPIRRLERELVTLLEEA
jgi:hypothetical protein